MVRGPRKTYTASRRGKHIAKDLVACLQREEVEEGSRHGVCASYEELQLEFEALGIEKEECSTSVEYLTRRRIWSNYINNVLCNE
jgi:hypothetical protein